MKNEFTYTGKVIAPLPQDFPMEAKKTFHCRKPWYGHQMGVLIGEVWEDGKTVSLFEKDDKEGNTKIFDAAKNLDAVRKETFTVYEDKLKKVDRYFLVYQIEGHTSALPTVADKHIEDAYNVDNHLTVEFLFVSDEGYKRYLAMDYTTPGKMATSMYDLICDLKDELCDIDEEGHPTYPGFYMTKDGLNVTFYNEVGLEEDICFSSVNDLLLHLNSVRIVDLEHKIV